MASSSAPPEDGSDVSHVRNLDDIHSRSTDFVIPANIQDWLGRRKPVWLILLLVARVADDKLQDRTCDPSAPSSRMLTSHEARHATIRRPGKEVDLFLTSEVLNMEVEITFPLLMALSTFMSSHAISRTDESMTTKYIIAPILTIWMTMWTQGGQVGYQAKWTIIPEKPSPTGGDVDVVFQCTLEDGGIVEAAVLEAKSPRSCGHADNVNYGRRIPGNSNGVVIGHQVTKQAIDALKTIRLHWFSLANHPVLCGLAVFPAHFFPSAYKDHNLTVFENVIETANSEWPEVVNHFENGIRFAEALAAWSLVVLVNSDEACTAMWTARCPGQVEQAKMFLAAAGEQLAAGRRIASLMRLWAMLCIVVHQIIALFAIATVKIRHFRSILLPNGQQLVVESA
ncbi:hypothetical protein NMY22_g17453 [Coprinellus aureogranulatus]|nr:hypothetical protein NMY22_g17453 [Coprinellus aureogranulatus]